MWLSIQASNHGAISVFCSAGAFIEVGHIPLVI